MEEYNFVIQLQGGKNHLMDQYIHALENSLMNNPEVQYSFIDDARIDENFCNIHLTVDNIDNVYLAIEGVIHKFVKEAEETTEKIVDYPVTIVVAHGKNGWDDYIELYNNSQQNKPHKSVKLH